MGAFCTRIYDSQLKTEVLTSKANDVREPAYDQPPVVEFVDLLVDSKGVVPRARQHHTLLNVGDHQLLCYGGICANLDTDNAAVDALPRKNPGLAAQPSMYSILDDTWRPLIAPHGEPPIQPRALHSAAQVGDGRVIIFGNHEKSDPNIHFLDVATGSWDTMTTATGAAPGALLGHTATVVDEQLMAVFGGENALGVSNTLHFFDSAACHWTRVVNKFALGDNSMAMVLGRRDHSMVVFGHRLLLFGGVSPSSDALAFLQFDSETLEWSRVSEGVYLLPWAAESSQRDSQRDPPAQKYAQSESAMPLSTDAANNQVNTLEDLNGPPPRKGHSCTMHRHYMIVFGGVRRSSYLNDLWVFDYYAGMWSPVTLSHQSPPLRRAFAGGCADAVFWYLHNGGNDKCFFRSFLRIDKNEIVRSVDSTFRLVDSRWSENRAIDEVTKHLTLREAQLRKNGAPTFANRLALLIAARHETSAILTQKQMKSLWVKIACDL